MQFALLRPLYLSFLVTSCSLVGLPAYDDDAGEVPDPGVVIRPDLDAGRSTAKDWGPEAPDTGVGFCGDGVHQANRLPIHPDYEECDDGNQDETDGCTTACRRPILGMAVGSYHSCVLGADRIVRCVGQNVAGQLGRRGEPTPWEYAFARVRGLGASQKVVGTGGTHTCALEVNGTLKCWGSSWSGQLGVGERANRTEPVVPEGMHGEVIDVWAGGNTTIARKADGSTWCAGNNNDGQCGANTREARELVFISSPELDRFTEIVIGAEHVCGIDGDRRLWCWGKNGTGGEIGSGDSRTRATTPLRVEFVEDVLQVAVADGHTCALHGEGIVSCWGVNWAGQLGVGRAPNSREPQVVEGLGGVTEIAASYHQTCAIGPELGLRCWGWNDFGQVGEPTGRKVRNPYDPEVDDGAHQPVGLYVGKFSVCSLGLDGRIFCWGMNPFGILGRARSGGIIPQATPMETSRRFLAVNGGHRHSCGVGIDRKAYCWGINPDGQIGDGTVSVAFTPKRAGTLTGVEAISAGGRHSCAVLQNGDLYCWGDNQQRQLGLGVTDEKVPSPSLVNGLPPVIQVATGLDTTCAVDQDQILSCWGADNYGQTGQVQGAQTRSLPSQVPGLTGVTQVAMWSRTVCAVTGAGQLYCWGDNRQGQVGDGTRGSGANQGAWEPVLVRFNDQGLQPAVRRVATGGEHVCAELLDQSLYCWGRNSEGQLGDTTNTRRLTPTIVGAFSHLVDFNLGLYHTCVVNRTTEGEGSGTARCVGWGLYGQLGDGLSRNQRVSVPVIHLPDVKEMALTRYGSCALADDGQAFCWGYSGQGNLGGNSDLDEWIPGLMLPIH
ncbi:MAG: hypothetical protein VX405_02930 [Myxococcota bacterium]|nr:hypothetical protein [Myxococcota bacterium]